MEWKGGPVVYVLLAIIAAAALTGALWLVGPGARASAAAAVVAVGGLCIAPPASVWWALLPLAAVVGSLCIRYDDLLALDGGSDAPPQPPRGERPDRARTPASADR